MNFRGEYARLVAVLCRRVGESHLVAVEDAVQSALMSAVETWPRTGEPDDPGAWLYRVAYRKLLDELRKNTGHRRILDERGDDLRPADAIPEAVFSTEIADDLLRMLFVCGDPAIPADSQLVLALKVLCGFGVREIALRLFTSEANVYKRLTRARSRVSSLEDPVGPERLEAVHRMVYLLFTEGYLSSHEEPIRRELCSEAIRLGTLLAEHPIGTPETCALVALMHLHAARLSGRQDASGGLLLLEEQDRSTWDRAQIAVGLQWLERSATGETLTRFHAEAGIAAEHALAPSFAETRWERVATSYALLEQVAPSALHRLNRAVAVAEWKGPQAGLDVLTGVEPPTWLAGSYLWSAVLADLHRRAGSPDEAGRYRAMALDLAPSDAVRDLLARRLGA